MTAFYTAYAGMFAFVRLFKTTLWFPAAVVVAIALVVASARSSRSWVQVCVAALLFVASAFYSIWVLQLGWFFAALGLFMLVIGAAWKVSRAVPVGAHPAGSFLWAGLALLLAPFANVFVLMPLLRPYFS
jgi:hypothetical protein